MTTRFLLLVLLANATACDELPEPEGLIVKPRILGALSRAESDPTRSSVAANEVLEVELIVSSPEPPTSSTWNIAICHPSPIMIGFSRCDERPLIAQLIETEPTEGAPTFRVQIPADVEEDLLLIGAICMGGHIRELDPTSGSREQGPCESEGVGQYLSGTLFVDNDPSQHNHLPVMEAVRFDSETWEPDELGDLDNCTESPLPQASISGEPHMIEVEPSEGSRERFTGPTGPASEELPVAFYATELGLSRLYSVIDADPSDTSEGATPIASVVLDPERFEVDPPAEGLVMRVEIVMRDGRGGVAHAVRRLCLVP